MVVYVHWTNLHDQSQNGPKLVANDFVVWSLTCIIHDNTDSVVLWEVLPNNADWDCFKTPILQEILKIQNPLLKEHCAFLEVIHLFHLFQSVGCVRNKLQFHTVQQNPNHLFGRWIEIGRDSRTWFMGSDRRSSSRKHVSEYRENGATFYHWQKSKISREDQRAE